MNRSMIVPALLLVACARAEARSFRQVSIRDEDATVTVQANGQASVDGPSAVRFRLPRAALDRLDALVMVLPRRGAPGKGPFVLRIDQEPPLRYDRAFRDATPLEAVHDLLAQTVAAARGRPVVVYGAVVDASPRGAVLEDAHRVRYAVPAGDVARALGRLRNRWVRVRGRVTWPDTPLRPGEVPAPAFTPVEIATPPTDRLSGRVERQGGRLRLVPNGRAPVLLGGRAEALLRDQVGRHVTVLGRSLGDGEHLVEAVAGTLADTSILWSGYPHGSTMVARVPAGPVWIFDRKATPDPIGRVRVGKDDGWVRLGPFSLRVDAR